MIKEGREDSLVVRLLNREYKMLNRKVLETYLALPVMLVPKSTSLKFIRNRSSVYFGSVDDEDNPNGIGAIVDRDGSIFEGHFLSGMKTGLCRMVKANGEIYQGTWFQDGIVDGSLQTDTIKYEGKFVNEIPEGKGKETFSDGSIFEGTFSKGYRVGPGVYKFADGSTLSGVWSHDVINGTGVFTTSEGDRYEGTFDNHLICGKGVYKWQGSISYVGEFANNQRNGSGTMTWEENGLKIIGNWRRDKLHRKAKFVLPDGTTHLTNWRRGHVVDLGDLEIIEFEFPSTVAPQVPHPSFNYRLSERTITLMSGNKSKLAEIIHMSVHSISQNDLESPIKVAASTGISHKTQFEDGLYADEARKSREPSPDPITSHRRMPSILLKTKTDQEEVKQQDFKQESFFRVDNVKQESFYKELGSNQKSHDDEVSESISFSDEEREECVPNTQIHSSKRFAERSEKPEGLSNKAPLKRNSTILQDFSLRTDVSEAQKLASLGYLEQVIRQVPDPIVAAQLIEVRSRFEPFEYAPGDMIGGFTEWISINDVSFYKGEWSIDKMRTGRGVLIDGNDLYEGYWHKGRKFGLGRSLNVYGDCFIGYWQYDVRCGFGILQRSGGYSYSGDWEKDIPNGKGIEISKLGRYEGSFVNGLRFGLGQLKLKGGTSYKGSFVNGKMDGYGVLTQKGKSYAGIWTDNRLAGKQVQVNSDMHLSSQPQTFNPKPIINFFAQPFLKFVPVEIQIDFNLVDDYVNDAYLHTEAWLSKILIEEALETYNDELRAIEKKKLLKLKADRELKRKKLMGL